MRVNVKSTSSLPKLSSILITPRSLVLNELLELEILFEDQNYNHVQPQQMLIIEGLDYQNWGTDDNYVINWVLSKLQLERK